MRRDPWGAGRGRRATAAERVPAALATLLRRNQRRYGGFVVHLGVVLLVIGIAGSMNFSEERTATVAPGERIELGRFSLRFEGLRAIERATHERVEAAFRVFNDPHALR